MTDAVMQFRKAGEADPPDELRWLIALRQLLTLTTTFCQSKAEVNHFLRTSRPALAEIEARLPVTYAAFKECVIAYREGLPDTLPEGLGTGGMTMTIGTPPVAAAGPEIPDAPLDDGEAEAAS